MKCSIKITTDPNHKTIFEKNAENKKKRATERRKCASQVQVDKRQHNSDNFGKIKCHKCNEEKFKKDFSKRQFKYKTPTCRKCTNQIESDEKMAKSVKVAHM